MERVAGGRGLGLPYTSVKTVTSFTLFDRLYVRIEVASMPEPYWFMTDNKGARYDHTFALMRVTYKTIRWWCLMLGPLCINVGKVDQLQLSPEDET
jgi:hypothetical protein